MNTTISLPVRGHVRFLIRRDMPEVLDIDVRSFDRPWGEEEFLTRLRARSCIGMVIEVGEKVVGYMVFDLHPKHLRLVRLAVDPDHRRCGLASQMLANLAGRLSPERRTRIRCEVSEWATPAHHLLAGCGYQAVRVEKDAYMFAYRLRLPK